MPLTDGVPFYIKKRFFWTILTRVPGNHFTPKAFSAAEFLAALLDLLRHCPSGSDTQMFETITVLDIDEDHRLRFFPDVKKD